jgi:hypothetical protein
MSPFKDAFLAKIKVRLDTTPGIDLADLSQSDIADRYVSRETATCALIQALKSYRCICIPVLNFVLC